MSRLFMIMTSVTRSLIATTLVLLILTGCAATDSGTHTPVSNAGFQVAQPPKVCALLSAKTLKKVLGAAPEADHGMIDCRWGAESGSGGLRVRKLYLAVSTQWLGPDQVQGAVTTLAERRAKAARAAQDGKGGQPESVTGLGEEGYGTYQVVPGDSGNGTTGQADLIVRLANALIEVNMGGFDCDCGADSAVRADNTVPLTAQTAREAAHTVIEEAIASLKAPGPLPSPTAEPVLKKLPALCGKIDRATVAAFTGPGTVKQFLDDHGDDKRVMECNWTAAEKGTGDRSIEVDISLYLEDPARAREDSTFTLKESRSDDGFLASQSAKLGKFHALKELGEEGFSRYTIGALNRARRIVAFRYRNVVVNVDVGGTINDEIVPDPVPEPATRPVAEAIARELAKALKAIG
ncbi:hypothetical protein ACIBG8_09860 [Nonomuraea sp. NPDC050556]|uniref:hypothetical protein n=1 Tax=Nonomuraea sp. NPDC050556 TaxID=3364369 RepID=UPI00379C3BB2